MFRVSDFYPSTKIGVDYTEEYQNAADSLGDVSPSVINDGDKSPAFFWIAILACLVGIRLLYEFME